ncbi:DUF2512 family protein [Petroclostridium sp. X23]|uniref:DUF2512 family protein n=1 Tax=Petroclostridium sp. X23 TaxID=3045146 RepID=UPI0024AD8B60|nr:DUF2512 family protein [Petroclostridium sp. X23]WHH60039.1 DUF2512 family protein [Petroclostridium sp. X23]
MKHINALLIKFMMIAVALEVILMLVTDLSFGAILYIALAVTLIAYVIGDLLILPASNNTVATIADAGLALVTIFMFNYVFRGAYISFADALLAAAVLGVGEWIFHKYVARAVFPERQ